MLSLGSLGRKSHVTFGLVLILGFVGLAFYQFQIRPPDEPWMRALKLLESETRHPDHVRSIRREHAHLVRVARKDITVQRAITRILSEEVDPKRIKFLVDILLSTGHPMGHELVVRLGNERWGDAGFLKSLIPRLILVSDPNSSILSFTTRLSRHHNSEIANMAMKILPLFAS